MHSEGEHHIVLGFKTEIVISSYDNEVLGEFFNRIDNIGRFKVARYLPVNVEDLEGILNDSLKVHWQVVRITGIWAREDKLLQKSTIFNKLAEFFIQFDLKL